MPDETSPRLVPLAHHREQQRFIDAVDARDPSGIRIYREYVLSSPKKGGSPTTAAAFGLWALVGDDLAQDREVIIVASDLAQAADIVFSTACKLVQRHPWLQKHLKVGSTEISSSETVVDPATGGRYKQSHVLRALPRDVRGLHGLNASCTIYDEILDPGRLRTRGSTRTIPWRASPP